MINLNIYRFELLNKVKEQQVLSFYNENEDLLDTMNEFCSYIHQNIRKYTDAQGKYRTFTLDDVQKEDLEERIITGYFDSAYTGEKSKVKDGSTNRLKFDIYKKDLVSKDFFYLIHVPKGSKQGFLIVEKKENHGVKQIFENAFNAFMRLKGVSNYSLKIKQAPPRYFIKNFLDHGILKELRLIDGVGPTTNSSSINLGREERVFKPNQLSKESIQMKNILVTLFNNFSSEENKIPFLDIGEFEEIAFVLEYGKVSKTFYVKNKDKIRSNVDVTNLVEFEDGEPTTESLIRISLGLINLAA